MTPFYFGCTDPNGQPWVMLAFDIDFTVGRRATGPNCFDALDGIVALRALHRPKPAHPYCLRCGSIAGSYGCCFTG